MVSISCALPWPQLSITDRSKAVVLLWFSDAGLGVKSFGDVSPYVCSYYSVELLSGHHLGNSCLIRLNLCSLCNLTICTFLVLMARFGF